MPSHKRKSDHLDDSTPRKRHKSEHGLTAAEAEILNMKEGSEAISDISAAPSAEFAETAAAPDDEHKKTLKILHDDFDTLRQSLTCQVCEKLFYEPYVLHCGHTFCYRCLSTWFNATPRMSCPNCRERVAHIPAPSYTIKSLVTVFMKRVELLPDGETTQEHEAWQKEEEEHLAADKANKHPRRGGLFQGRFNNSRIVRRPIVDPSDNVARCPDCHWELEDDCCPHCGIHFDSEGAESMRSDDYDSYMDDFDDVDGDLDEPDGYGADDSEWPDVDLYAMYPAYFNSAVPNPDGRGWPIPATAEDREEPHLDAPDRGAHRQSHAMHNAMHHHAHAQAIRRNQSQHWTGGHGWPHLPNGSHNLHGQDYSHDSDEEEEEEGDDEEDAGSMDGFLVRDDEDEDESTRSSDDDTEVPNRSRRPALPIRAEPLRPAVRRPRPRIHDSSDSSESDSATQEENSSVSSSDSGCGTASSSSSSSDESSHDPGDESNDDSSDDEPGGPPDNLTILEDDKDEDEDEDEDEEEDEDEDEDGNDEGGRSPETQSRSTDYDESDDDEPPRAVLPRRAIPLAGRRFPHQPPGGGHLTWG